MNDPSICGFLTFTDYVGSDMDILITFWSILQDLID